MTGRPLSNFCVRWLDIFLVWSQLRKSCSLAPPAGSNTSGDDPDHDSGVFFGEGVAS
jgi:hypothetical protein